MVVGDVARRRKQLRRMDDIDPLRRKRLDPIHMLGFERRGDQNREAAFAVASFAHVDRLLGLDEYRNGGLRCRVPPGKHRPIRRCVARSYQDHQHQDDAREPRKDPPLHRRADRRARCAYPGMGAPEERELGQSGRQGMRRAGGRIRTGGWAAGRSRSFRAASIRAFGRITTQARRRRSTATACSTRARSTRRSGRSTHGARS